MEPILLKSVGKAVRLQKAAVRQASVWVHPALAQPIARALSCALPCHGATLFGCFSAEMLATEATLLVEFGLLWLLAWSGLELLGRPTLATLESTAFLALGFGAVNGQDFRMRRDPLGRVENRIFLQNKTSLQDHYADLLFDTSGLQSDLLVVEARARGQFFWASATKKWTIIDWKVNVSKPAPIHGEPISGPMATHAHIPRANKTCSPTEVLYPNLNQEPNNIQQTYAKPTFFTFT